MARAGISYSQVAAAAAKLAAAGINPTVDTVRAALGDTGSKGTIAPMLKQWKKEHQDEAVAAGTGLPADLLEVIKAVYDRLEAGAHAHVELARTEHDEVVQGLVQQLEAERAAGRQLRAERNVLDEQLAQMKAAFAHERDELQRAAVAMAKLQAETVGMGERFADRVEEVHRLTAQLAQASRQFEYFQEKTLEQREKDRLDAGTRITLLEQDTRLLRAELLGQQQAVAALRAEKEGLQLQMEKASDEVRQHLGEAYTLREQLKVARGDSNRAARN